MADFQLPPVERPVRLLMGDMALEIEPETVITLISANVPAFLQAGAEELPPREAAVRFGAKQAVRALLGLMNATLAAQGVPAERRPIIPKHADPIAFGLSYLVWFGLQSAGQHDWTAQYVETADGARITGVAPAPARRAIDGPADDAAAATIAGDPAPAQLVAETRNGDAHQ